MNHINFKDTELKSLRSNEEGVTRAKKDKETKKYNLIVIGMGNSPMKLSTFAESKDKAIKYAQARWKDCIIKIVN
tara:strand:- start:1108 stop:1332 length:225 start_codon:yes stop_codon:yes gene_type:complete